MNPRRSDEIEVHIAKSRISSSPVKDYSRHLLMGYKAIVIKRASLLFRLLFKTREVLAECKAKSASEQYSQGSSSDDSKDVGLNHSSDEVSVMEMERRVQLI
ncbi:MAG: hypothetical protein ABIT08_10460 [Bacteroidia bacterium]